MYWVVWAQEPQWLTGIKPESSNLTSRSHHNRIIMSALSQEQKPISHSLHVNGGVNKHNLCGALNSYPLYVALSLQVQ